MKVHGVEITQAQIDTCIERMKACPFQARDIAQLAELTGVPEHIDLNPYTRIFPAYRFADRLIQRERKAKNIKLCPDNLRLWRWVK